MGTGERAMFRRGEGGEKASRGQAREELNEPGVGS